MPDEVDEPSSDLSEKRSAGSALVVRWCRFRDPEDATEGAWIDAVSLDELACVFLLARGVVSAAAVVGKGGNSSLAAPDSAKALPLPALAGDPFLRFFGVADEPDEPVLLVAAAATGVEGDEACTAGSSGGVSGRGSAFSVGSGAGNACIACETACPTSSV